MSKNLRETFSQYLHRKKLEASIQRGLLMGHKEFYQFVLSKLPKKIKKPPFVQFTLYRWETGMCLPSDENSKLLKKSLGK